MNMIDYVAEMLKDFYEYIKDNTAKMPASDYFFIHVVMQKS